MATLCDEKTFTEVFRNYAKSLNSYLYYQLGDTSQAQDITQEAFMTLWRKCAEVQLASARGYVFMVAKNKMLNMVERKKVKLNFSKQTVKTQSGITPEHILEEKEFQAALEQAIQNLPEKQRVVFLMSRIDRLKYAEIAELLGISKKAVEKRIYLALDALRKINKQIP